MVIKKRLNVINDILDGSSSRMRRSYFEKNYNEVLIEIENFCSILDLPFKQMIWHWVNDYPKYYKCVCGNDTTFNRNWLNGYKKNCSAKCAQNSKETKVRRKKTTLSKYGVDNVAKLLSVKKKQASTNLERYGTTSSFQNEEVKKKYRDTCLKRYGVDHYFKTEEFKKTSKDTMMYKYGVGHYVQSLEYIDKTIRTNREKYGVDWFTRTDEYKAKAIATNNSKYGVDHYSQSPIYVDKVKNTNKSKYGTDWYFQSYEFRNSIDGIMNDKYGATHYTQTEEYKNLINSDEFVEKRLMKRIKFYDDMGFEFISASDIKGFVDLKNDSCGHTFSIHPTTLQRRLSVNIEPCSICNPLNSGSGQEKNIMEWLDSIGVEYIPNSKSIIPPFELDIYIPSKNIAIEYNGLYWHSDLYKHSNYHLEKTDLCNEQGINLLHIWEDDWLYKRDIVESIIRNFLGLTKYKIPGRKCDIRVINDKKLVNEFLDMNHIQGKTTYRDAVGLFYNGELVSCMLFHSPKKGNELVRFCNKLNTTVHGSASKLFKYYIDNNDVDEISTFADISMFSGKVYEKMGFEMLYRTSPNYWWVVDGIRKHRFNYNKSKLIKDGFDPLKTEVEIMCDRGYHRVYGCGQDKYVWRRNHI